MGEEAKRPEEEEAKKPEAKLEDEALMLEEDAAKLEEDSAKLEEVQNDEVSIGFNRASCGSGDLRSWLMSGQSKSSLLVSTGQQFQGDQAPEQPLLPHLQPVVGASLPELPAVQEAWNDANKHVEDQYSGDIGPDATVDEARGGCV